MKVRVACAALATVILLGTAASSGTGAAQPSPEREDVLTALLAEVRGLRAAMEQMAAAGPRVQLALGRLQIQEQRVTAMLRRQDDIAQRIPSQEQQVEEIKRAYEDRQDRLTREMSSVIRKQIEEDSADLKIALDRSTAALSQLRAEEAQLAASIAGEQSRWIEINAQLEEMERSLRDVGRRR